VHDDLPQYPSCLAKEVADTQRCISTGRRGNERDVPLPRDSDSRFSDLGLLVPDGRAGLFLPSGWKPRAEPFAQIDGEPAKA
jgi:hypothetical protein